MAGPVHGPNCYCPMCQRNKPPKTFFGPIYQGTGQEAFGCSGYQPDYEAYPEYTPTRRTTTNGPTGGYLPCGKCKTVDRSVTPNPGNSGARPY